MKNERMTLQNLKTMLSRAEMKKIVAGSASDPGCYGQNCNIYINCCTWPLSCSNGSCGHP